MSPLVVWKTLTFWKILLIPSAMWNIWFSVLYHEDGDRKYPRNVGTLLQHLTASYKRTRIHDVI